MRKRRGRLKKKFVPTFAPTYVEVNMWHKDGYWCRLPIIKNINFSGNAIQVFVGDPR